MFTLKRILLAAGSVIVVSGIYLWFFGVQTMCALTVRYTYRKMPEASTVPVALSDTHISNVPHSRVSYFGYEFELPWDDVDDQKSKTVGQIRLTAFHSGDAFWFSVFPPRDFINGVMKTANLDPQRFQQLYGAEALDSDYNFHVAMLETTPAQINPFVSKRQAVTSEMLLLIKTLSMPAADSGIFSIQTPNFQGFQFERTDGRPGRITDELFSKDGGVDAIFFQKANGSAPALSQSEVNRVIQSIHRVSTPTSNASQER